MRLVLFSCAILLSACGPFGYLKKVGKEANRAVAEAEAAGAEKHAPYEYWGSVAYLEQSKTMMAFSEYERSFDYGVRAKQLADEAKEKANRVEAGESVLTAEDESLEEVSAPSGSEDGIDGDSDSSERSDRSDDDETERP